MASAGTASIDVQGDFSGFNKGVDDAGKGFLSKADGWGKAAALLIGPALAVGAIIGLEQIGESFDTAFDKIRVSTGQTGQALEGLQGSFKNVLSEVPSDMGTVADAISLVNQRLGLTGAPLEALSEQFINLSRITGTDLKTNVDNITRVFGDWGIATGDQATATDKLFRATQASGITIGDLTSSIVQFGAPFRNLGFTFEQSAALLAQFNKTGVNTDTVIAGLKKGVGTLAKAGEDVPSTFKRIVEQITALGPGTEATGLAIKLFGQRAGPDLADAITGGKFSVDEMLKSIEGGTDTINQAASDTDDWREKLDILKNKTLVALEPVASAVFDGFTRVAGWLIDTGLPKLGDAFGAVRDALAPVVQAVSDWAESSAWPTIQSAAKTVGEIAAEVWQRLTPAFKYFEEVVWPQIQTGFQWLLDNRPALVAAIVSLGVELATSAGPLTVIATAIAGVIAAYRTIPQVKAVVDGVVKWLSDVAAPRIVAAFDSVRTWFEENWPAIQAVFEKVWKVIQGYFQWLIDHQPALISTLVGIAAAIGGPATAFGALGLALVYAYQNFEGFRNVVDGVVTWVNTTLVPSFQAAWTWIQTNTQLLALYISERWADIQKAIDNVVTYLKVVLAVALAPIVLIWTAAHDQILGVVNVVWENIRLTIETAIRVIKDILDVVLGLLSGDWGRAWDGIKDIPFAAFEYMKGVVGLGIEAIKLIIEGVLEILKGVWNAAWEAIKAIADGAWEGIKAGVAAGIDAVLNFFRDLPGNIASALGDLGSLLYDKGRELVQGFIDGIKSQAGAVLVAIGDITGLGSSGTKGAVVPVKKESAGGNLFTHPSVTSIAENGAEAVINGDQAVRLLWAMANGQSGGGSGGGSAQAITVVNHGVASDPNELARITAAELTWALRTKAA